MSEPGTPDASDLEDIQGLVYGGWPDHQHAGFLFARFGDDPRVSRRWLDELRPAVTPVARHRRRAPGRLQVALSASGLAALGVPADVVGALPRELQAGMASRRRALDDSDPATWQLGGPGDDLDVLIMVYALDPAARAAQHFGFAEGLSQPFLHGLNAEPRRGEDRVPVGEILLGYPNAYGQYPISPVWDDLDLGRNGSFLVFRKLEQNVAAFWGWIADHARRLAGGDIAEATLLADLIGAKLVGRWRSGASLVSTPDRDDPAYAAPDRVNAFKYLAHDPAGLRCPITAHIRRANPRDARGGTAQESETVTSRHRILRRGRSFGSPLPYEDALAGHDDGVTRGLYFICLQSSIARGFEFIQQTWLANPGFAGLHREPDLIVADPAGRGHITIPAEPVRLRLDKAPTVVTHVGGGYFFLPSLAALRRIAAGP
jgi:Dyp-type peroxidase family